MPKTQTKVGVGAWSYSRLADYEGCPAKFRYKHISRLPDKPGPALLRGTQIHEMAERYVKSGRTRSASAPFPPALARFQKEFVALRSIGASTEAAWGFDASWQALPDWFHPETWVRIKADASYIKTVYGFVIDYKTGREYPAHADQLNLYAIGMLQREPTLKHVAASAWYLDHGTTKTFLLKRADVPKAQAKWKARVAPLLKEKAFKPTPGEACRFCAYAKSKGGPCVYA